MKDVSLRSCLLRVSCKTDKIGIRSDGKVKVLDLKKYYIEAKPTFRWHTVKINMLDSITSCEVSVLPLYFSSESIAKEAISRIKNNEDRISIAPDISQNDFLKLLYNGENIEELPSGKKNVAVSSLSI